MPTRPASIWRSTHSRISISPSHVGNPRHEPGTCPRRGPRFVRGGFRPRCMRKNERGLSMSSSNLFPASVVGSMPRSHFVRDLIGGDAELSREEYDRRMDAAVRYIVAVQEQAGIDGVAGGGWGRHAY